MPAGNDLGVLREARGRSAGDVRNTDAWSRQVASGRKYFPGGWQFRDDGQGQRTRPYKNKLTPGTTHNDTDASAPPIAVAAITSLG